MIPAELGEINKVHIKTVFEGSDRGRPSLVYLAVIPPAEAEVEQTAAINEGKLILIHDGQKAKIAGGATFWSPSRPRARRTGSSSRSWRG